MFNLKMLNKEYRKLKKAGLFEPQGYWWRRKPKEHSLDCEVFNEGKCDCKPKEIKKYKFVGAYSLDKEMNNYIERHKMDLKPCQFKDSFTGKPVSQACPLCSTKEGKV